MKKKIQPWRIVVFILSLLFIVVMWARKDIIEIYKTMPNEQIASQILTTVAVFLFNVGVIAGVILLIRWLIQRVNRSK